MDDVFGHSGLPDVVLFKRSDDRKQKCILVGNLSNKKPFSELWHSKPDKIGKLEHMVKLVADMWSNDQTSVLKQVCGQTCIYLWSNVLQMYGQTECPYMVKLNAHIWSKMQQIYGQKSISVPVGSYLILLTCATATCEY